MIKCIRTSESRHSMPIWGVRLERDGRCKRFSAYSAGSHYIVGEKEGGPIYQLGMECCMVPEPSSSKLDRVLCVYRQPHAKTVEGKSVALPPPLDAILFDASLVFLSWCIGRKEWQPLDTATLQQDIASMAFHAGDYTDNSMKARLHWVEYQRTQNTLVNNHTDLYHLFKKPRALERKEPRVATIKRSQVETPDDHSEVDEPSLLSSDSSDDDESTLEDASESETSSESSAASENEAEDEDDQEEGVETEDEDEARPVANPPLRRAPSRRCKKI